MFNLNQATALSQIVKIPISSLEEFATMYLPVLDSLPDATVLTELAIPSKIILANKLATKLFLYTEQELTKLTVMDLLADSSKQLFVENRTLYEQDLKLISLGFKGVDHDYYGKRSNEQEFPLDRSLSPIAINDKVYVLIGFRDLTELKLSVSRFATKEAVIDCERKALQQQQDFMDTLCHELLNPLNGAYNGVDLLTSSFKLYKDLLPRLSPYEQGNFFNDIEAKLAMITDCIQQQKVTVIDMLTITQLDNKKISLNLTNFELTKAITELCNGFLDKIQRKNLKLILDLPTTAIWLRGDKYKILQILANLTANSIDSTCYGDIKLTVNCDPTCHGNNDQSAVINFILQDTGAGLFPQEIDNLFLPFGREQAVTGMEYSGSKLALSISKKLIELMHGEIKVASQKFIGTSFSFYVRCNYLDQQELLEAVDANILKEVLINENKELNLSGKKILIVEDNRINMVVLTKILEPTNCICYQAYDGEDAIEQFKRNRFDLIFMDIGLPKLSGIEVAKWIRNQESLSRFGYHTPIICLSAFSLDDPAKLSEKESVMDEYIAKPYDKKSIFEVIIKYILLKPGSNNSLSEKRRELALAPIASSSSYHPSISTIRPIAAIQSESIINLNKVVNFNATKYLGNRANTSFNEPTNLLNYYNRSNAWSSTSLNTLTVPAPLLQPIGLNTSPQTSNTISSSTDTVILENSVDLPQQGLKNRLKKPRTCLIL